MTESVEVWVCKQNIERFKSQLLQPAQDKGERSVLKQMLERELGKLDELIDNHKFAEDPLQGGSNQFIPKAGEANALAC